MPYLRILAGPLIGAIIGYITNYIAIKMLFRPLTPKYLFGVRLPFTPGIIPRRKAQLADALGKAVFARFFNWDDLEIVFQSDTFAKEVAERVALELNGDKTVGDMMRDLPRETADAVTAALSSRMKEGLLESGTIRKVALFAGGTAQGGAAGVVAADEDTSTSGAADTSSSIKAAFASSIATAYAGPIADRIEAYIRSDGDELIAAMLREEAQNLKGEKTGDVIRHLFPNEDALKEGIRTVYLRFMAVHVRPIVESIDIVTQITGKMNQMSAGEVEVLVLDIVARELRMVVWFGAFLGATIGVVNIFI